MHYKLVILNLVTLSLIATSCKNKENPENSLDARAYQHGIDCIDLGNNKCAIIWSSNENPPKIVKDENWGHDIYYTIIATDTVSVFESYHPIIIASEAQEPASSAITSDGHIMITTEDGWNTSNTVAQRYGVYDTDFHPIKPYPNMVENGGHSGHVAAVDNQFVVFYSEGWVDGEGVDNLGTGDDVKLKTYQSTGTESSYLDVSVGNTYRDWWPLIAGSNKKAALVWQRFVKGTTSANLMLAIYNPKTNQLLQEVKLEEKVKYYSYNVEYLPTINRFLIIGTYQNTKGFSFLIDENGAITAFNKNLPAGIVRESKTITRELKNGDLCSVFPTLPNTLGILKITANNIEYINTIGDLEPWFTIGVDGFFINDTTVCTVSLSPEGLKKQIVQIHL